MTRQQDRYAYEDIWRKYIARLSSTDHTPKAIYVGLKSLQSYRKARGWPADRVVRIDGVEVKP